VYAEEIPKVTGASEWRLTLETRLRAIRGRLYQDGLGAEEREHTPDVIHIVFEDGML
jgi:hypothetical protein